jgi:diguanylate cyclase (GGDEF)-like protein
MSLGGGAAVKLGFCLIAEAIPSLHCPKMGNVFPKIASFRLSISSVNMFPSVSGRNVSISNSFSGDYPEPSTWLQVRERHPVCIVNSSDNMDNIHPPPSLRRLLGRIAAATLLAVTLAALYFFFWRLRQSGFTGTSVLYTYGAIITAILSIVFASDALLRFRGNPCRIPFILAIGILMYGLFQSAAAVAIYRGNSLALLPLAWLVPRFALALLFLVALQWERHSDIFSNPFRELLASLLLIAAVFFISIVCVLPFTAHPRAPALVPQPWEFVLALLFLAAALSYWKRLRPVSYPLDYALWAAASCSVVAELAMSQSVSFFDAPSICAHVLQGASYALLLGGSLLDNARLIHDASYLAASDPLTGLANYRQLIDVMEAEIQRSRRTHRTFALLLLDMDGLKPINDKFGHSAGNDALKHLAQIIRSTCRSGDTPARYGGDEFALVLPETEEEPARLVTLRICQNLAQEPHHPPVTASIGFAIYPVNGNSVEELFSFADAGLYQTKFRQSRKENLADKESEIQPIHPHGEMLAGTDLQGSD